MENEKVKIYHQLNDVYEDLLIMDEDGIQEVVTTLNAMNFKGLLDYYVDLSKENKLDDMDLLTCRKIIDILQFVYNNTPITPPVSDDDYDKLYQVISDKGIEIVGAVNAQGKPVREHEYPDLRGTLNKVHFMYNIDKNGDNRRSVEDWIHTIESILGYRLNSTDLFEIWLQPKWDGVSVVFECDKDGYIEHALLRGDVGKNLAVDIAPLFKEWKDFTEYARGTVPFGVKTEVLMNRAEYEKICKEYKVFVSPRSATTSIVNEKVLRPELGKYLTIEPLRIQFQGEESKLLVNEKYDITCNLYNMKEVQYFIQQINEAVREDGLSTDGVVMYLKNPKIQETLGRDGAINRFEVAYKFPAEEKKTKLIDVDFSVGLGSNITPVAKIEPVIMMGKTIRSISLGSPERFESLDLHEGDEVIVKYEIIPYLDVTPACKKNPNGFKYLIPTHCKYCDHELKKDPTLKCVNEECPSRIVGTVVNYINKMRIDNINFETVSTFFDEGFITGIESLYELEKYKDRIIQLPGFGLKSYNKIIEGIMEKNEVYDYEMMGSLGIPNLGERMFKKVLSAFDLDTLIRLASEHMLAAQIIGLPGFGEKTAVRLQKGIISKLGTIDYLRGKLKIKNMTSIGQLKGKVCFTKVRDDEFANKLIEEGYEVSDSLTKETTHLIVPSLSVTSGKIERAKKYGIQILTLDEAIRTL